jgi:SAM-dependent methyltransferase
VGIGSLFLDHVVVNAMAGISGATGERRLYPMPWDHCAYLLRCMRTALQKVLTAELTAKPHSVVVDLGCGERPYERLLEGLASRYIGVDVQGNSLADITWEPNNRVPIEDESADLVLSTEVLEHVVDVSEYLMECHRLLREDGLLLLTTHGCWTYHPYPTDVRRWTCWGLRHEIELHGFRVESLDGCLGPLAYTTQLRLQLARGFLWKVGLIGRPVIHALSWASQVLMWLEDRITPRQIRQENSAVYVVAARKPVEQAPCKH